MKTQILPRSNNRDQPTRTVNDVTIRRVSEAYGCTGKDNKPISSLDLIYYSIWVLLATGLIIFALTSYPPSVELLLAEIMFGVLFSGGIFIFKARKK